MKRKLLVLFLVLNYLQARVEFNEASFRGGWKTPTQEKCEDALKEAMSREDVASAAQILAGSECSDFFNFAFSLGNPYGLHLPVEKLLKTGDPKIASTVASVLFIQRNNSHTDFWEMARMSLRWLSPTVSREFFSQNREQIMEMSPKEVDEVNYEILEAMRLNNYPAVTEEGVDAFLSVVAEKRGKDKDGKIPVFKEGLGVTATMFRNMSSEELLNSRSFRVAFFVAFDFDRPYKSDIKEDIRVQFANHEDTMVAAIQFIGQDFFTKQCFVKSTRTHFDWLLGVQVRAFKHSTSDIKVSEPGTAIQSILLLDRIKAMREVSEEMKPYVIKVGSAQSDYYVSLWEKVIDGLTLEEVVFNVLPVIVDSDGYSYYFDPADRDVRPMLDHLKRYALKYKSDGKMTLELLKGFRAVLLNSGEVLSTEDAAFLKELVTELEK